MLLLLLAFTLLPTDNCAQQATTPLDSLLEAYESARGDTRLRWGQALIDSCSSRDIFFGPAPHLNNRQTGRERDLLVWFAAERFLTTTSYFREALTYIRRALPLAGERTDLNCTLLCDQAYCLFKTSDYSSAVEVGQQAMRLCQQTGNDMQLSRAYLYLSIVNHALQKHDEATALVEKAIKTCRRLGDDNVQLHNALGVACELFCSARQVDKGIDYGRKAVEAAHAIGFMPGVANHLTQLSYAYDRKGDYAAGLRVADSAITIVKNLQPLDRNQLALALEYKSWNLIDLGRHAEAVETLQEAIRLEEEVGNTHAAWNDYRTLAEAMTPIDPQGAIAALNRYVKMGDSIHTEQMKELMSQANAEFHNDELQKANSQSRRMNRIILFTSLMIFLLLAAVIALLWFAFRQKKRREQTLQQLNNVREQFFTNVTHEFRTPLTLILGLSRDIQHVTANITEGKAIHEAGSIIERQGLQLLTLVNQLLDFSKVKSAIGPQQQTRGDMAAFVGMVVEAQQPAAQKKNIAITYSHTPSTIPATFSRDYISKLIGNLISNAVKYTPDGGKVAVEIHAEGRRLIATVSDNGPGIAHEHLPHIFEPFYRANEGDGQGSGVGLALVHQIVEALDGHIAVDSRPGYGATFTVSLPIAAVKENIHEEELQPHAGNETAQTGAADLLQEEPETIDEDLVSEDDDLLPAEERTEGGPRATMRASILIVEDNRDLARFIAQQLKGRYAVSFAPDGEEGIRKARLQVPDLIITDVMMPHTDGLQLCRTLRSDPATNHIPLIIITAKVTTADRIRGLEAGADAYLFKPFNEQELHVRISQLLLQRELLRQKFSNVMIPISPTDDVSAPNAGHLDASTTNHPSTTEDAVAEKDALSGGFATQSSEFIQGVRDTILRTMSGGSCTVDGIANELCITPSQLRRKMNAITGMPPKKYIMKVRMEAAREMLQKDSGLKLSIIAEQCGFYDLSHFLHLYKETYGTTPSADR